MYNCFCYFEHKISNMWFSSLAEGDTCMLNVLSIMAHSTLIWNLYIIHFFRTDSLKYCKTLQTRAYFSNEQTNYVLMNVVPVLYLGWDSYPKGSHFYDEFTKLWNMHLTNYREAWWHSTCWRQAVKDTMTNMSWIDKQICLPWKIFDEILTWAISKFL